jgi:hypothetical protein
LNLFLNNKRAPFPQGDKLPATNLPVSTFGQVPRDQRQQELEYFLNKQYNAIGLRIQQKLISVDRHFNQAMHPDSAVHSLSGHHSNYHHKNNQNQDLNDL